MARGHKPEHIGKIFDEIEAQNDRATIIVGVSFVEHFLDEALVTRLRKLADKERETVFSASGIFPTLSRKILGAYALGLIGPKTRRELDLLRSIRNEAAHNVNPVTFDTSQIKSRVKELTLINAVPREIKLFIPANPIITPTSSLRDRFVMSLRFLSIALWLVQHNSETPGRRPFELPTFLNH